MADVRDVVARLAPEDRAAWTEHRTCMRRCYLAAVNDTIGINKFEEQDDNFLDLIDIRLALLFDRAGHLPASLEVVTGKEEAKKIEQSIIAKEDAMKAKDNNLSLVDKATGWGDGKK